MRFRIELLVVQLAPNCCNCRLDFSLVGSYVPSNPGDIMIGEVGFRVLVMVDLLLIRLIENLGTWIGFSGIGNLNWSQFGLSSIYK